MKVNRRRLYNIPAGSKIETQIPAVSVLSAQGPLHERPLPFPEA